MWLCDRVAGEYGHGHGQQYQRLRVHRLLCSWPRFKLTVAGTRRSSPAFMALPSAAESITCISPFLGHIAYRLPISGIRPGHFPLISWPKTSRVICAKIVNTIQH